MAASQARLLSITARIHDVEYQAQSIQNAKVQLATQSDQVYQDYLEALDATTLTITDLDKQVITANFNNLWGKNAVETGNSYALFSSKGALIVSEDEKQAYDEYKNSGCNDPYMFAIYMAAGENVVGSPDTDLEVRVDEAEAAVGEAHANDTTLAKYQEAMNNAFVKFKEASMLDNIEIDDMQNELYNEGAWDDETFNQLEEIYNEYLEAENCYRNRLYSSYAEEVYTQAAGGIDDFNQETFDYYLNLFKKIEAAGGNCISIEDYNEGNNNSDAANDSEWLKNMIECGKISISIVNHDNKTGEFSYSTTSPSSDTYLEYTTTTSIDKTELAKAEAEYERASKEIDTKDKRYDMDLSKLETERTALTTEYDSVKKVISDNIERTFGIFS